MRILAFVAVLLIVFGIVALGFQSFTYFTVEHVVDAGPSHVDVQKPHTIVFHPAVGAAALVAGVFLMLIGAKAKSN
jgi:uncharacterized membrane protein HdeD (DUF308 family)